MDQGGSNEASYCGQAHDSKCTQNASFGPRGSDLDPQRPERASIHAIAAFVRFCLLLFVGDFVGWTAAASKT
jgi:hypothetical protein